MRGEIAKVWVAFPPASLRAERSNPSSILAVPRHGLLRCARNDGDGMDLLRERVIRARIRATPWLAMMEPEYVARSQNLQHRKHRVGDIGSTVPTAELHRLDSLGIRLADRTLDSLAGFRRR